MIGRIGQLNRIDALERELAAMRIALDAAVAHAAAASDRAARAEAAFDRIGTRIDTIEADAHAARSAQGNDIADLRAAIGDDDAEARDRQKQERERDIAQVRMDIARMDAQLRAYNEDARKIGVGLLERIERLGPAARDAMRG